MFDTVITIVGNTLNSPERRRLEGSQVLVAKFKVAATSRRYDKESGRWVDGASLRVRVNCWRRLAENVVASVISGDPVIVTGRMYTRDWIGDDGQHRVSYEMDAVAVGHDLARGQSRFERNRRGLNTATTVVGEDQSEDRVNGLPTEPAATGDDAATTTGAGPEAGAGRALGGDIGDEPDSGDFASLDAHGARSDAEAFGAMPIPVGVAG